MNINEDLKCEFSESCPGCQTWSLDYIDQKNSKIKKLQNLFTSHIDDLKIEFLNYKKFGLRDRMDFSIQDSKIGLQKSKINSENHKIDSFFEISKCLQLSPELAQAFNRLKKYHFKIKKGSLRIRHSPYVNKPGLWLDFSNLEIKELLFEKKFLTELSKDFFVEIGQKKKSLELKNESDQQHKLSDPKPKHWFASFDYHLNKTIPLQSACASFTQPSMKTAQLITDTLVSWIDELSLISKNKDEVIEFGSGLGQLTIPFLSLGFKVHCFEIDELALSFFNKTLDENKFQGQAKIYFGNYQNQKLKINNSHQINLAVCNPPKSGLKNFAKEIIEINPRYIFYVSCYPESLKIDSEHFFEAGFKIKKVTIVDQFPQTHHFETLILFEKANLNELKV